MAFFAQPIVLVPVGGSDIRMFPRIKGQGLSPQSAHGAAEEGESNGQLHDGDAGDDRLGRQRRGGWGQGFADR